MAILQQMDEEHISFLTPLSFLGDLTDEHGDLRRRCHQLRRCRCLKMAPKGVWRRGGANVCWAWQGTWCLGLVGGPLAVAKEVAMIQILQTFMSMRV